jgi:hypothetical protein
MDGVALLYFRNRHDSTLSARVIELLVGRSGNTIKNAYRQMYEA